MSAEIKATVILSVILLVLCLGLFFGYSYESNSSRADAAEASVLVQSRVIQMQADQLQAFNTLASTIATANTTVDAKSEETVIEYRTILRREKTCDLPVPAGVSDGLLDYTNRLRASAMHAITSGADATRSSATASGQLTYCQAVLWIQPLLAAIEKANNQLSAIQQAEQLRQGKTK
ncbi:hypothetical protein [Klebsiella indica]|uniref:hypothetical protein n=1 Tax=Klebsiella indica TaxID=2582917 RepID=UPI0031B6DECD